MPDSLTLPIQSLIHDHGPMYAETISSAGGWIIEPWNALSSLVIAAPAVYWAWKLRGQYRKFWFLALCMPFLFLNGLGSTLFHATRSSDLLLMMDVLPAAIVTMLVSIYFWVRALPKWWMVIPVMVVSGGLRPLMFYLFEPPLSINMGYLVGGLTFLIPLVIILSRTKFQGVGYIIGVIAAFTVALLCRQFDLDSMGILPMGTHFLWHVFTGIGGFMIGGYLYSLEKNHQKEKEAKTQVRGKMALQT